MGVVQSHQCISVTSAPNDGNIEILTEDIDVSCAELLQGCLQRYHHALDRVSGSVDLVGVFVDLLVVHVRSIFGSDHNVITNA